MSINRVLLSGNLTRDAELRRTSSGLPVLGFSLAVNDRRKDTDGEWKDFPNFVDCTLFGTRAENVERFMTKGSKIALEGKLRWSQWERDGQKRSKIEVIVEELEFLSRFENSTASTDSHQGENGSQSASQSVYDEDIPF